MAVSSSSSAGSQAPEIALDAAASVLFAAFVAFLFLGYLGLYPSVPFSALGAVALLGSLAVLFTANLRADRRRPEPAPAPLP